MAMSHQQFVSRLRLCGLSRPEASLVGNEVKKWLRLSGAEWTVNHIKLIKQTIISIEADYPAGISPFVRTRNRRIVGPFRTVQRLVTRRRDKALAVLLQYTAFVSAKVTASQEHKFVSAVESNVPAVAYEFHPDTIQYLSLDLPRIYVDMPTYEFTSESWSSQKRAPGPDGKSHPENDLNYQIKYFLKTRYYRTVYYCTEGIAPEDHEFLFNHVLKYVDKPKPSGHLPVGKISAIQEPGFKARFIANPNRVVQHALKPLGDFLYRMIQNLPWDCTFDQNKAQCEITSILEKNKILLKDESKSYANKHQTSVKPQKVYCYDLSNASDSLPIDSYWTLLMPISEKLSPEERNLLFIQLRLFELAARSEWFYKDNRRLTWTRGQPLGLYPSFALMALLHGAVLLDISIRVHGKPPTHPLFYILGDDVVIFDDEVANQYEDVMKNTLKVQISESKTLISDKVAEFAGDLYLGSHSYIPTKWRSISEDSFIDFLKVWGIEGIALMPKYLRNVAKTVASLPEPFGLGFNPEGKSLDERLAPFMDQILSSKLPPLKLSSERALVSVYRVLDGIKSSIRENGIELITPLPARMNHRIPTRDDRPDHGDLTVVNSLFFHLLTAEDVKEFLEYLYSGTLSYEELLRKIPAQFKIRVLDEDKASHRFKLTTFKRYHNIIGAHNLQLNGNIAAELLSDSFKREGVKITVP